MVEISFHPALESIPPQENTFFSPAARPLQADIFQNTSQRKHVLAGLGLLTLAVSFKLRPQFMRGLFSNVGLGVAIDSLMQAFTMLKDGEDFDVDRMISVAAATTLTGGICMGLGFQAAWAGLGVVPFSKLMLYGMLDGAATGAFESGIYAWKRTQSERGNVDWNQVRHDALLGSMFGAVFGGVGMPLFSYVTGQLGALRRLRNVEEPRPNPRAPKPPPPKAPLRDRPAGTEEVFLYQDCERNLMRLEITFSHHPELKRFRATLENIGDSTSEAYEVMPGLTVLKGEIEILRRIATDPTVGSPVEKLALWTALSARRPLRLDYDLLIRDEVSLATDCIIYMTRERVTLFRGERGALITIEANTGGFKLAAKGFQDEETRSCMKCFMTYYREYTDFITYWDLPHRTHMEVQLRFLNEEIMYRILFSIHTFLDGLSH